MRPIQMRTFLTPWTGWTLLLLSLAIPWFYYNIEMSESPESAANWIWLILSMAAVLGLRIGAYEAEVAKQRIVDGDRRKLPHAFQLAVRILIAAVVALLVYGFGWTALAFFCVLFIGMTITHRLGYNDQNRQRFYYMGPAEREKNDSWYDGLMWRLADLLVISGEIPKWAPYVIASVIEVTSLVLSIIATVRFI